MLRKIMTLGLVASTLMLFQLSDTYANIRVAKKKQIIKVVKKKITRNLRTAKKIAKKMADLEAEPIGQTACKIEFCTGITCFTCLGCDNPKCREGIN